MCVSFIFVIWTLINAVNNTVFISIIQIVFGYTFIESKFTVPPIPKEGEKQRPHYII